MTSTTAQLPVTTEAELLARLRSVRRGRYGAFFLYHVVRHPFLSIQFNGDIAYLHYFPSENHPGFQPRGVTPENCSEHVHFLQTDGGEADSSICRVIRLSARTMHLSPQSNSSTRLPFHAPSRGLNSKSPDLTRPAGRRAECLAGGSGGQTLIESNENRAAPPSESPASASASCQ